MNIQSKLYFFSFEGNSHSLLICKKSYYNSLINLYSYERYNLNARFIGNLDIKFSNRDLWNCEYFIGH